jgi:predicted lysophospholipase L1 biosynthesis ABC-type transport system permease subunit
MIDLTVTSMAYHDAATMPLLPSVLDYGVLLDLGFARSQLPDFANEAHWQVWLGPDAPADAVHRLEAAGLVVTSVTTQADRSAQLGRQGTALALLLLVACAIAGAVLAAGATALAVAVTGRRRSFELAALRAVGVRRRVLLRACVLEQLILLGTGFVLGLPTGIVAARLALPEIPEFSDTTPVPLDFSAHVVAIAAFAAVVLALLVLTALLAGRALMRAAVPTRLREAAP